MSLWADKKRTPLISAADSWHPIFVRYLAQLGEQVAGLGVDPSTVPASADDPGLPGETPAGEPGELTGKIGEVFFDCFGDFTGFVLENCPGRHYIPSHEKGLAEIVLRACRERCTVTVRLGRHVLQELIVRC